MHQHHALIAGIASVGAVAISYLMQSAYLAPFGLQPDQVGLNEFTSVARLIPCAIISLVLIITCLALCGWILSALRGTGFGAWIAAGLCLVYLFGVIGLERENQTGSILTSWQGAYMALMGLLAIAVYLGTRSWGGRELGSILAVALLTTSLVSLAYSAVSGAADELRRTGSAGPPLGIIGANVELVRVTWSTQQVLPRTMTTGRPQLADLILIADGPERYALFDCERGRTYLVQHDAIGLEILHPVRQPLQSLDRCS